MECQCAGQTASGVHGVRLMLYGVARAGLPGRWPTGYRPDPAEHPGLAESITGVPAAQAIRFAKGFARNATESGGRSMIIMGGGICHWFTAMSSPLGVGAAHVDRIDGRNGGGWAHYVGQERCVVDRVADDGVAWSRPPRQAQRVVLSMRTPTNRRYDGYGADKRQPGKVAAGFIASTMDLLTSVRQWGWSPFYPGPDRSVSISPTRLAPRAATW